MHLGGPKSPAYDGPRAGLGRCVQYSTTLEGSKHIKPESSTVVNPALECEQTQSSCSVTNQSRQLVGARLQQMISKNSMNGGKLTIKKINL